MNQEIIKGLPELNEFLNTLPVKIERNILRGAMRAGAKLVEAEAKRRVLIGPPSFEGKKIYGGYMGALHDSIRITTKSWGDKIYASVVAGGKSKKTGADVFYAHIIEGFWKHHTTAPYPIRPSYWKRVKALFIGGRMVGGKAGVMHPPIQGHPFLRPALDGQAHNAVIAAAEYMKKRLETKHGIDTSDVVIEGDE